ncbi:hypothetical protein PFISCL1PPCAC_1649, partial [Pristionchus fissidentatus]
MGIFSKGFTFLLKDFACWTSTHGIPHIGGSNNIILRIFWILVVIACILGFLVQLQTLIRKYLAFSVNTETKLNFEERHFPVVTICNMNPWKKNDVANRSKYMEELMKAYNTQAASSYFGFTSVRNGARRQRAARLTSLASSHLFDVSDGSNNGTNTFYEDPGYNYNDMVVSCTYNAATCNETLFARYFDATYGRCVQFNFNEHQNSSRAGPLYGLRLTLKAEQGKYLPWVESAGAVVAIHNKSELPYPDVGGYYAPIGTASAFGVKYVATTRQPAPYGDCSTITQVKSKNYEGTYQVETCYRCCTQDEIIKQCGCYYPGLPYAQGDAYSSCFIEGANSTSYETTSRNLNCIDSVMTGGFDILKACDCPQPCEVQTYATTATTAMWPSLGFTPNECNEKKQDEKPRMEGMTGKNTTKCLDWYKKNTLLIEVYYERMNYQVLSESPAYTFVSCLSEIAGQVGLFLGMSIISVFEFFTLLLLIFYYVSSHKSRRMELAAIDEYVKNAEEERAALDRKAEEKEAKRRAEKLRKEADLYDDDHHDSALPPKVTNAE